MASIGWWNTNFGEQEQTVAADAIASRHMSHGVLSGQFEAEICRALDVRFAVATTSGSAALTLALLAHGIGPGDEVIVPDITWIATANAAAILGARVVLADCKSVSPLIDPEDVKAKITDRTKAILPVHLNGRGSDLDQLNLLAKQHGIAIIEDAAQAFGSRSTAGALGTIGSAGAFSFGVTKLISTGQGGGVVTNDAALAERLRLIQLNGAVGGELERYETLGLNFKFTDILAAIGTVQISRLDDKIAHVNSIYSRYRDALADHPCVDLVGCDIEAGEVAMWSEVRSPQRAEILAFLQRHEIHARPCHPPIHNAAYLKNHGEFPNANRWGDEIFILPCGPNQPLENIDKTIEVLRRFKV